jgi:hypothetical protein
VRGARGAAAGGSLPALPPPAPPLHALRGGDGGTSRPPGAVFWSIIITIMITIIISYCHGFMSTRIVDEGALVGPGQRKSGISFSVLNHKRDQGGVGAVSGARGGGDEA